MAGPPSGCRQAELGLRRTGAPLIQLYKAVSHHKHSGASSAAQGAGPAWPRGRDPLAFSVTSEALLLALCPGAQILSQIQEGISVAHHLFDVVGEQVASG